MSGILANTMHRVRENVDHQYANDIKDLKEVALAGSLGSLAVLVTSIAFAALGFAFCVSSVASPIAIIPGFAILSIAVPVAYLSFNAHKMCENLKTIANNPHSVASLWGLGGSLDVARLKTALRRETICFDWFIDLLAEGVRAQGHAH